MGGLPWIIGWGWGTRYHYKRPYNKEARGANHSAGVRQARTMGPGEKLARQPSASSLQRPEETQPANTLNVCFSMELFELLAS